MVREGQLGSSFHDIYKVVVTIGDYRINTNRQMRDPVPGTLGHNRFSCLLLYPLKEVYKLGLESAHTLIVRLRLLGRREAERVEDRECSLLSKNAVFANTGLA